MAPFGKYYAAALFFAIATSLPMYLMGQAWSHVIADSVKQLFAKPRKVKVRHYQGHLDGFHDLSASLGFYGSSVQGYFTLLSSQVHFRVKGTFLNDSLYLQEFDAKGNCTGSYLLQADQTHNWKGEWHNYDSTVALPCTLKPVSTPTEVPRHCGANKWIAYYKGQCRQNDVRLWVHRTANGRLFGNGSWGPHSVQAKGTITAHQAWLRLYDEQGRSLAFIQADASDLRQWLSIWHGPTGEKVPFTLARVQTIPVDCYSWADYRTAYAILFPKTTSAPFNDWVMHSANDWLKRCYQQATQHGAQLAPSQRARWRAEGWYEIAYDDAQYISGVRSFIASWLTYPQVEAFIFDKKHQQLIDPWQTFFHKDARKAIEAQLHHCLTQHYLVSYEGFAQWIDTTISQALILLSPQGITFRLPPHPVFGNIQCTLSTTELQPWWRKPPTWTHENNTHGDQ